MSFGPKHPTSVDLYVRDLLLHSRLASASLVLAEQVAVPFSEFALNPFAPRRWFEPFGAFVRRLASEIKAHDCRVVIVHQHLPTAAALKSLVDAPVILVVHGMQRRRANPLRHLLRTAKFASLDGLIFVSNACMELFRASYLPEFTPIAVVPSGLDMNLWKPGAKKRKLILFVGRPSPHKAAMECAEAMAQVLPRHPDWRGAFILAAEGGNREVAAIRAACATLTERVTVQLQTPVEEVREAMVEAAIALAPTRTGEAFGRTALEAMASGAAFIGTGVGGQSEVMGPPELCAAARVWPVEPGTIAAAIETLIGDPAGMRRMADAGRRHVASRFDIAQSAAAFDDFIEDVAQRWATSRVHP